MNYEPNQEINEEFEMSKESPETAEVFNEPASKPVKISMFLRLVPCILGVLLGLIIMIVGATMRTENVSADIADKIKVNTTNDTTIASEHEYYGGDAYTGIQQAGSDAANNAAAAVDNIAEGNGHLASIYEMIGVAAEEEAAVISSTVTKNAKTIVIVLGALTGGISFLITTDRFIKIITKDEN